MRDNYIISLNAYENTVSYSCVAGCLNIDMLLTILHCLYLKEIMKDNLNRSHLGVSQSGQIINDDHHSRQLILWLGLLHLRSGYVRDMSNTHNL